VTDSLAELQSLARRDAELRAESDRLRSVDATVAALRARVETLSAFLDELPGRRARVDAEVAEAHDDVERRRRELAEAEAELERASGDEDRRLAAHARERAADHVAVALAAAERAAAARDELEREAADAPRELAALHEEATRLSDVPAPADDPAELVDWASRAHASLFVAAGTVDQQRDRLVREANELGSMLLGEPTYGSTVAQVAARVAAVLTE
jgi:vacuolar-type H+-ATPase subunit I/STV1